MLDRAAVRVDKPISGQLHERQYRSLGVTFQLPS